MNITKEIKKIMIDHDITISQLNDMLNKKNGTEFSPQNLSKKLNKDDIKFGDAEDILAVLEYDIKIVKK